MTKFNHMLIPIDFSTASILALKCGMEIAKITHSQVHVVHVFRLIDEQVSIQNNQALALRNKLTNHLKEKMKVLESTFADPSSVKSTFELQIGFPEDVIESLLLKHPSIDTIILGTTGAGENPSCFGSTLSAIVNNHKTTIVAMSKNVDYNSAKNDLLSQLKDAPHFKNTIDTSHVVSMAHSDFNEFTVYPKGNSDRVYIIETKI